MKILYGKVVKGHWAVRWKLLLQLIHKMGTALKFFAIPVQSFIMHIFSYSSGKFSNNFIKAFLFIFNKVVKSLDFAPNAVYYYEKNS